MTIMFCQILIFAMSKYLTLVSKCIILYSGLPESEIKELLGITIYEKALIVFNKDNISKALQSQHTYPDKFDSGRKRKARKRTKEDLLLQCNEKVTQQSIKEENIANLTKTDFKIRYKLDRSQSFGKDNLFSSNFEIQKSKYLNSTDSFFEC
jgi:RecB family endonuclease NucS